MRILKEDKYKSILDAARAEFIQHGFKDASMRRIAKNANVGLSNIYNYYKSKDNIYLCVVQPAIDALQSYMTNHHTEKDVHLEIIASKKYREEVMGEFIELIDTYKTEIYLLLYSSEGSSAGNFRSMFTGFTAQIGRNYLVSVKKHYPEANTVISDFFMHAYASWMTGTIGEIIRHDIKKHKVKEFFDDYFRFTTAGWRELIEI
jgi:Transcriptional regulator